jgi:antitoxin MazE
MAVQILKKWGNSPAVRIPATIMQSVQLRLDKAIAVRAEGGRIIIEAVQPVYKLDDLLNGITDDNCHGEVDFASTQGQELL